MTGIPVLEVGGTHVAAAAVDIDRREVGAVTRVPIDSQADAETVLDTFATAIRTAGATAGVWGVAMPGPFDYDHGVGLFRGVGKYEALYGVDVRAGLAARLGTDPRRIVFTNDADAFALGEALLRGVSHLVGITLGTGVGSGWVRDGRYTWDAPGVPPEGRINPNVPVDGGVLEDRFSIRAIRRAHRDLGGPDLDVREIAHAARGGDVAATTALREATVVLGRVLGPRVREFGARLLVFGGSIAGSWDLLAPWFLEAAGELPPIAVSAGTERSAMLGTALAATAPR